MSLIFSLKKRTTAIGLSSVFILSNLFIPNVFAKKPYYTTLKTAPPLEVSQALNYSDFKEVSKYLGVEINFKLKNSLYLKDIYLAAYQGVICLNVYRTVDPGTFDSIKQSLLSNTIDLIKIFRFFSNICPLKQEIDYSPKIKSLEKFLVERLGVKKEDLEDSEILTRSNLFPHMSWRRDSKSRVFMVFNSNKSIENEFFKAMADTIKKINAVAVNLHKLIHNENDFVGEDEFNALIAINTLHDFKLKDTIFSIKKLYYEEKLKPKNIHSGTYYYNPNVGFGKIKEGRDKISVDDYVKIITLNMLDYAYLKNNLCKEVQKNMNVIFPEKLSNYYRHHSSEKENIEVVRRKVGKEAWYESNEKVVKKYNKMLRKILFLISYFNESISCAEMNQIPKLRDKISKIEKELIYNHLAHLPHEDVIQLDKDVAKIKQVIDCCEDFYAESLKNNMIPLNVTKADLDYSSTVEENDPSSKILKEKPLGMVKKIIYKSLKKYDNQFRPSKVYAYEKNLNCSLADLLEALNDLRPKRKNKNTIKFHKSPNELIERALREARLEQEDPEAAQKAREFREKMNAQKRASRARVKKKRKNHQIISDMKFEKNFKIHKSNGQILTLKRMNKLKKFRRAFKDFQNKKNAPME